MSAKHHTPQPKRSRRTAKRFAIDALEKRVRRIERNYQRDLAEAVHHAYDAGWLSAYGYDSAPSANEQEGPRAHKET